MKVVELRELLAAATPGPWRLDEPDDDHISAPPNWHVVCRGHDYEEYGGVELADANLIVAAVNALPTLLDLADALARAKLAAEARHPDSWSSAWQSPEQEAEHVAAVDALWALLARLDGAA